MYFNFKYMDCLLKTNIKEYLIDLMTQLGYIVSENKVIMDCNYKNNKSEKNIKDKLVNLLHLDKNNMSDFEKKLTTNDKFLEKHFNLRLFIKKPFDNLQISIDNNLFTETTKNKITKLSIIDKLMNVLEIPTLESFNKNISKKFNTIVDNTWLNDNIKTIINLFDIRGKKYNNYKYYTIYQLLITLLKNMFDEDIFDCKRVKMNDINYNYYTFNRTIFSQHTDIITKYNIEFIE